jgi:hypothetical protein
VARNNDTPWGLNAQAAAGQGSPYQDATGVQPRFAAQAAAGRPGRDAGRAMRLVALVAVVIGLAALTAAACVLSYSSMHYLAIQGGVSARLASVYPLIFDALLVLAGWSVLALRGAGLASRVYGWLCMLVLLGALAAGGALHAAAKTIPHRLAGVVAAIVPWALVLIGFGLLLALLRYARVRRLGQNIAKAAAAGQEERPFPDPPARQTDLELQARIPRQPAHEQADANPVPAPASAQQDHGAGGAPVAASELNPAPTPDSTPEGASEPPAFRRTHSSPTPPEE